MECDEDNSGGVNVSADDDVGSSALNTTILNYYKKFGRKRDLEQYFSLSTAQSEIRDPTSLFWRRMKSQSDSDSGEKKSESSTEICRISIKCSIPEVDASTSQDDNPKTKSDTESPPIITEDVAEDASRHTDDDSVKSDDNQSQKSLDATLDTSMNKAFSPTSSVTSQRKLEWDSLADVGYGNETDRKTSASSLSTLERLALRQQYSNNDTHDPIIGPPTAHSTPQDENDIKPKGKKTVKTTKIYRRDVDFVEINMPHGSEMNPSQAINVNLTKHISFNVEKGGLTVEKGGLTVENIQKGDSVTPDKVSVETEAAPQVTDKEIQTSLTKTKDKSSSSLDMAKSVQLHGTVPVLINLNTLRKKNRRKKLRTVRKKLRSKRKSEGDKENLPLLEKSGEQVSEAESFEYMPGHIYNQNQMKIDQPKSGNATGNKSSLESSGILTTDSSKGSKHSFTKDLEKSISLLKVALQKRYDDSNLKQKLIKEIVQRLLNSNYRGDESTTDFLSGISFSSKKLGLSESNQTTTSTSDANNTGEKAKMARPKKSILRVDKFNPQTIASTSQSAPNLPSVSNSEKPVASNLKRLISSTTESDISSKEKNSSDTAFAKTSSEELYQKYIEALRREESYKRHLRDKEMFLKQKLVRSDSALRMPTSIDIKSQNKLKDLIKDLTRNNYDDGSGDASKLEGGSSSNIGINKYIAPRKHRSHSVFTLSSGNSECPNRKGNTRKNVANETPNAGHYCCCPYHSKSSKMMLNDSSVQVNMTPDDEENRRQTPRNKCCGRARPINDTEETKDVCLCSQRAKDLPEPSDNFVLSKWTRMNNRGIQSQRVPPNAVHIDCSCHINTDAMLPIPSTSKATANKYDDLIERISQSSQTNLMAMKRAKSITSSSSDDINELDTGCKPGKNGTENVFVHEAIRCIQTEISINPQISDPVLSDINVINSADCVELISEQYREVSKSTIQNEQNIEKVIQLYPGSEFSQDAATTPSVQDNDDKKTLITEPKLGKCIQTDIDNFGQQNDNIPKEDIILDNFAIPIQGTNMTLMVSLDTNKDKPQVKSVKNQQATKVVATDKVDTFEKGTSLRDECSKGVQSQNTPIFPQIDGKNAGFPQEMYRESDQVNESRIVNTIFTREGFFNNIYPNDMPIREQVPLLGLARNSSNLGTSRGTQAKVCEGSVKNLHDVDTGCQTVPNEPKCRCPESSKCKGTCGDNAECMKSKPFRSITTDTSELGECIKPKPLLRSNTDTDNLTKGKIATQIYQSLPSKPKCKCPESSKCGGDCGEDAACMKQRPLLWSATTDLDNAFNKSSKESPKDSPRKPRSARTNKPKCKCPESAKCGGVCGEDADCMKQDPCHEETPQIDKKRRCKCPVSSKCEGTCGEDAPCMKGKEAETQKNLDECIKYNTYPKNVTINKRNTFFRSNTNPTEFDQDCCVQTEPEEETNIKQSTSVKYSSTENSGKSTSDFQTQSKSKATDSEENGTSKDLVLEMIQDITKRYSKKDIQKNQRKKCFKEIMTILNYLLDTEDTPDPEQIKALISTTAEDTDTGCSTDNMKEKKIICSSCQTKKGKIKNVESSTSRCTECGADARKSQENSGSNFCRIKESIETYQVNTVECSANTDPDCVCGKETLCSCHKKIFVDKGVQLSTKKSKAARIYYTESSDVPVTTDIPCTSSDSATCKVLNKIKNECEKFHQKRCLSHGVKRCQCSSSTSVNCDHCKRVHHCYCKSHKCRGHKQKTMEKIKKKCVAYNLIIQTSESMISEENSGDKTCHPLKSIIVKVPPKRHCINVPFKELAAKIEGRQPSSPRCNARCQRSRSLPNESGLSSTDDNIKKSHMYTVREYLERNRPDFVEQCSKRQDCLKFINETRASERAANRELLSMQLQMEKPSTLNALSESDLRHLARKLGVDLKRRKVTPKFTSEREMKKHSEKIYKSLPEVVQKKAEAKKESIKKTNLLMASIFKKNLQKKTLSGAVNLSNYSTVVKI